MKTMLCGLLALFCGAAVASAQTVVATDSVETSGGWTSLSAKGGFALSSSLISPSAGTSYFKFVNSNNGTDTSADGLLKFFTGVTLQSGTYTVSFDIGTLNTASYSFDTNLESTAAIPFYLMAEDSSANYTDRITTGRTSVVSSTPALGTWTNWTYTFTVDNTTLNANGTSAIGSTLGFMIYQAAPALSDYAFDNLSIAFTAAAVPEPSSTLALGLGVALLGVGLARTRFLAREQAKA